MKICDWPTMSGKLIESVQARLSQSKHGLLRLNAQQRDCRRGGVGVFQGGTYRNFNRQAATRTK